MKESDGMGIREKKCAKCGKLFISAPQHIYREKSKWFCSWTCYNHRNNEIEKENYNEQY